MQRPRHDAGSGRRPPIQNRTPPPASNYAASTPAATPPARQQKRRCSPIRTRSVTIPASCSSESASIRATPTHDHRLARGRQRPADQSGACRRSCRRLHQLYHGHSPITDWRQPRHRRHRRRGGRRLRPSSPHNGSSRWRRPRRGPSRAPPLPNFWSTPGGPGAPIPPAPSRRHSGMDVRLSHLPPPEAVKATTCGPRPPAPIDTVHTANPHPKSAHRSPSPQPYAVSNAATNTPTPPEDTTAAAPPAPR